MKFLTACLLIVLFVLSTSNVYAQRLQGQAMIDSMLKELPKQKEDTNKVKLLDYLMGTYSTINPIEGLRFGQQCLDLATKLGWEKGIAVAFKDMGIIYHRKFDDSKALECFSKAFAIAEKIGYKRCMAATIGSIASVYNRQSDYPKALEYLFKELRLREEMGDKHGIEMATCNIGNIYSIQKDYSKALEYYSKALKLDEEMGDKDGIAAAINNMAVVYQSQKDYSKALEYQAKALKLNEEMENKEGIMLCMGSFGNIYAKQHNYTEAVDHFFKALKMAEEMGDEYVAGGCLGNIGTAYLDIVKNANKTVGAQSSSELQRKAYIPDGMIPQGRSALLHKAVEYLQRSIAIQKKIGDLNGLQGSYENLSVADSMLGDHRGALEAYKLYTVFKDSVFNGEKKTEIMRLGMMRKMSVDSLKSAQQRQVVELKYQQQRNYTYMGIAGMILLIVFSVFIIKERGKSEKLLLNILPAEVASELKTKRSLEARHFESVTVLFTDFVNFTEAGERMHPRELIDELHTCFKAFDEITSKYNIEKIKTIGDAYLAVAGLPTADPRHAENVLKAAMEMNAFMQERAAKMGERTFAMRTGIHSGSVVAGVVGVRKYAYDVWGDTVNTAARMEQNCEAGRINMSQASYELVKDKFSCIYRGEIEAKGKGMIKMYYLSQPNHGVFNRVAQTTDSISA